MEVTRRADDVVGRADDWMVRHALSGELGPMLHAPGSRPLEGIPPVGPSAAKVSESHGRRRLRGSANDARCGRSAGAYRGWVDQLVVPAPVREQAPGRAGRNWIRREGAPSWARARPRTSIWSNAATSRLSLVVRPASWPGWQPSTSVAAPSLLETRVSVARIMPAPPIVRPRAWGGAARAKRAATTHARRAAA